MTVLFFDLAFSLRCVGFDSFEIYFQLVQSSDSILIAGLSIGFLNKGFSSMEEAEERRAGRVAGGSISMESSSCSRDSLQNPSSTHTSLSPPQIALSMQGRQRGELGRREYLVAPQSTHLPLTFSSPAIQILNSTSSTSLTSFKTSSSIASESRANDSILKSTFWPGSPSKTSSVNLATPSLN